MADLPIIEAHDLHTYFGASHIVKGSVEFDGGSNDLASELKQRYLGI